ncbi:centromere protein H (CENP-H)-domain-containing protein [Staphylotrichum tortipilum]|uniref:Centromere protein H (CENP-H)-domain-containing protein n=1 Tax=Staphylotrichum tortipilum TaxID=2831512 RepID=A0AAN6MEK4_9PEZI|nr:centromere protein H (CENP-H)-domain-containing protein [Staphylotrichum longicolle]
MASQAPPIPSLEALTEAETNVSVLFNQLQQLQLELALLRSQQSHHGADKIGLQTVRHGLAVEHSQLLKAKATFALRNTVVENVVAIQPALEAVHNANASPLERDLLPTIEERDDVATTTARMCLELRAARDQLADLEAETVLLGRQNTKLASEILELAGNAPDQKPQSLEGGRFGREIAVLESQVKSGHHRWRVMKGLATASVAGSGIDWARDERLRDLVLDLHD